MNAAKTPMRLLVTGASGHVGGAVARRASSLGHQVTALFRKAALPGDEVPGITWRALDITDHAALADLAAQNGFDACIHCAAVSNEAYAAGDPLGAFRTNVAANASLLELARLHGWRRFVMTGTGSVFQEPHDASRPILEDATPTPRNIYGTTKAEAEMTVALYRRQFGLSASSVRISWVFGPPVVDTAPTRGPIPSFLVRALRGEAIVEGGGDFAASFTFIDDVAAGLVAALEAPSLAHPVYHLGHGRNFSAGDVAEAVRAAVPGCRIELGGGTDPWTRYTSLRGPLAGDRFLEDTGFRPRGDLASAVARYADWLRQDPARLGLR